MESTGSCCVVTETGLSKRGIPLPDPDLRAPPFVKRQILQQSHSEQCGKIMHIYMYVTYPAAHAFSMPKGVQDAPHLLQTPGCREENS
jgi:hypothetical protein